MLLHQDASISNVLYRMDVKQRKKKSGLLSGSFFF